MPEPPMPSSGPEPAPGSAAMAGQAMGFHLLLIGMMGSGKTTVGALLAQRLVRPHLDTDQVICEATGRSVAELFALEGEAYFRAQEIEVLEEAVASTAASVISVGGGAVLSPTARWRLGTGGLVIWLRADPATLADRLGDGEGRPLMASASGPRPASASDPNLEA
ncbi:MAG: shikimate kinase, partial [Acidimicrobiales bacterium]